MNNNDKKYNKKNNTCKFNKSKHNNQNNDNKRMAVRHEYWKSIKQAEQQEEQCEQDKPRTPMMTRSTTKQE